MENKGLDPKLLLKIAALNSRLHALEDVFLSVYPDKKSALESSFMKYMKEAMEDLASKKSFVNAVKDEIKGQDA